VRALSSFLWISDKRFILLFGNRNRSDKITMGGGGSELGGVGAHGC